MLSIGFTVTCVFSSDTFRNSISVPKVSSNTPIDRELNADYYILDDS